jgi:hypothetical protein
MGSFAREEILEALESYRAARDASSQSGDWNIWADVFTEDAIYVEHAYGELHGREEIRAWITGVMAPFPRMTFPQDWVALDETLDAVVFQCQNQFPEPFDESGKPFQFPNWSRLVYAGNGLWSSEEDIYNPAKDAPRVIKAWTAAGGRFQSDERIKMKHR